MITGSTEYNTLHKRLGKILGKPNYCQFCGTTNENTKFQWAHKHDAEWNEERNNWYRLCVKCHSAYDITLEQRQEIGRKGGYTSAGIPRHAYTDEFKAKVSATLKEKGIKPPSRKGQTNRRSICEDCGIEYASNWMNRHKENGTCSISKILN